MSIAKAKRSNEMIGRNQEYLTDDWCTPKWLIDDLNDIFHFTLDPCCYAETAKAPKFYTVEDNGLLQSWRGERVFMNPPYGRNLSHWIMKAALEGQQDKTTVVGVFPVRSCTAWWHEHVLGIAEIWMVRGRIAFEMPDGAVHRENPAPACIAVWHKDIEPIVKSYDIRKRQREYLLSRKVA